MADRLVRTLIEKSYMIDCDSRLPKRLKRQGSMNRWMVDGQARGCYTTSTRLFCISSPCTIAISDRCPYSAVGMRPDRVISVNYVKDFGVYCGLTFMWMAILPLRWKKSIPATARFRFEKARNVVVCQMSPGYMGCP